jgi:hypothetical protein
MSRSYGLAGCSIISSIAHNPGAAEHGAGGLVYDLMVLFA